MFSKTTVLIMLLALLTACAPAAPAPIATSLPATITPVVPTVTATPLVVVDESGFNEDALRAFANDTMSVEVSSTDQPYASEGVVVADDGSMWMYDTDTGKMVNMETPEDWEIVSLSTNDDGKLQAELGDGSKHWFDTEKGEWVEVEKVYNSCLDPELQQEMADAFPEASGTGLSVQEQFQVVRESENYARSGFPNRVKENGELPDTLMYVGSAVVEVNGIKVVCANFVSPSEPNQMVPVLLGFEKDDSFKELIWNWDARTPGEYSPTFRNDAKRVEIKSVEDFFEWMSESGVLPGDIFKLRGNTLPEITTLDEFRLLNPNFHQTILSQVEFLRLTNNTSYLERHKGSAFSEIASKLNHELGDVGILSGSLFWLGSAQD